MIGQFSAGYTDPRMAELDRLVLLEPVREATKPCVHCGGPRTGYKYCPGVRAGGKARLQTGGTQ